MKHFQPEQPTSEQKQSNPDCPLTCPYGQPPARSSRGSKLLLWILVTLCAAFAIGFGGYGIFLAVQQHTAAPQQTSQSTAPAKDDTPSQTTANDSKDKNPVGTNTNADFKGIAFADPAEETLSPAAVYEAVEPSVVSYSVDFNGKTAWGTAMVLTKDGYLLTTAHTIGYHRDADISALTADNELHKAVVVGFDSASDVAVLKIDADDLQPITFAKADTIAIGDPIYAVSGGTESQFCGVLSRGILSANKRSVAYDSVSGADYLQTDAAVGISGSGSPLCNAGGQVVAMNLSSSYLGLEDGTYAVPVTQIQQVINSLIRNGYVTGRVRLGISGISVTRSQASAYDIPLGIAIVTIPQDSSFSGTDVQEGDIITEIDGVTVTEMSQVAPILKKHEAGDKIQLKLFRLDESGKGGSTFQVTIALRADEGQTQQ